MTDRPWLGAIFWQAKDKEEVEVYVMVNEIWHMVSRVEATIYQCTGG